jgi:hypothetical protein
MKSVTFPQIDCRHSRLFALVIAFVIDLGFLLPEIGADLLGSFAKADID